MIEKFKNNDILFFVPDVARKKYKLKGTELIIFSAIFSYDTLEVAELIGYTGLTSLTITKVLGSLALKNLIEKKDGLYSLKEKKEIKKELEYI